MPSVRVASETPLFVGNQGWRCARLIGTGHEILGIDRHGQSTRESVKITPATHPGQVVFLGTDAACAAFAAETPLILQGGATEQVGSFLNHKVISNHWFENVLPDLTDASPNLVWEALSHSACFSSKHAIALSCRSSDVRSWEATSEFDLCEWKGVEDQVFTVVRRSRFDSVIASDWAEPLIALVAAVTQDSESERDMISIRDGCMTLWYVTALRRAGVGYRVAYDSLQHTLFAILEAAADLPTGFRSGRCVCAKHRHSEVFDLTWGPHSWSPLAGGFIIGRG